jgi:spermidine synthase
MAFVGRGKTRRRVSYAIFTTGFAGIIYNLVLIFAFQVFYGYVFHWMGLLVTALMVGIASGSLGITSVLGKIRSDRVLFSVVELAMVVFSVALGIALLSAGPLFSRWFFLPVSFVSGALIGLEFPLANKMDLAGSVRKVHCHPRASGDPHSEWIPASAGMTRKDSDLSETAGSLYAADLFGGWAGGVLGGVVLLPIIGIFGTCIIVSVLKLSSLILFVLEGIILPVGKGKGIR